MRVFSFCPRCHERGLTFEFCKTPACAQLYSYILPEADTRASDGLVGRYFGRWCVVSPLGEGGFGKVYHALESHADGFRWGALKVLKTTATERDWKKETLLGKVKSRHVAGLLDAGRANGCYYLVTEFVPGKPLGSISLPSLAKIRMVLRQVAHGLTAVHGAGVFMRDIKPENILVDLEAKRVVIIDFGIAKDSDDTTRTEVILGTEHYIAPDRLAGERSGFYTDTYSFACLAAWLVAGGVSSSRA